jgi:GNAT superfamily N-acetyltransferase
VHLTNTVKDTMVDGSHQESDRLDNSNGGTQMDINIRRLTPDLVEDYVRFFDATPHATNIDDHKCYCVWWCNDDYAARDFDRDFGSREKRRALAIQYVKGGNIQGYLAYCDDEVVGWCNANTKSDCLTCFCWRRFMGAIFTEESAQGIAVKSVFCFAISPTMRRKGIAKRLLEHVCQDAAQDGYDYVEAYPMKEFIGEAEDYMGPIELYGESGFTVAYETEQKLVMRKQLR